MTRKTNMINGEPSALQLRRIYHEELSRPVCIDGRQGMLEYGQGGWEEVAIYATFDDIRIVKCERASDDYEDRSDEPRWLETYDWQREDDGQYYTSLRNALDRRDPSDRST